MLLRILEIGWILMATTLACCASNKAINPSLNKIDLYYMGWEASSIVALKPASVIAFSSTAKKSITDKDYLHRFDERMKGVHNLAPCDGPPVDARIVCILHRSGTIIDTLSFGDMSMELNSKCFHVDTALLKIAAESVGPSSQIAIRKMLDLQTK